MKRGRWVGKDSKQMGRVKYKKRQKLAATFYFFPGFENISFKTHGTSNGMIHSLYRLIKFKFKLQTNVFKNVNPTHNINTESWTNLACNCNQEITPALLNPKATEIPKKR